MVNATILVVDDEPDLLELVGLTLGRMGLVTETAARFNEARALLATRAYDLCLTDMRLPDGDGLALVEWIQEHRPHLPVAVISAHGNVESAVRALKLGAFDFLSKPLDLGALRKLVASAIKLSNSSSDDTLTARGPLLVGRSPSIEQLRVMIARVARSQAPVHIGGESKANSSATSAAASRAPSPTRKAWCRAPRAARCSSTRSPTCRCTCR
jgi:two-component system response regulator PilR (NtrC family)